MRLKKSVIPVKTGIQRLWIIALSIDPRMREDDTI